MQEDNSESVVPSCLPAGAASLFPSHSFLYWYIQVSSSKTSCFYPSIICPVLIASNMWPPTPCLYSPSILLLLLLWCCMFAFTLLVAIRFSSYQRPLHVQCLFYQFHVHRAAATHVTAHVTFNTVGSGAMPLCVLTRVSHNELEMTLKVCCGQETPRQMETQMTNGATHTNWTHISQVIRCSSLYSLSLALLLPLPTSSQVSLSLSTAETY